MQRRKKPCKECKQHRYLYARGMCLSCDKSKNPEKHGFISERKQKWIAPISKPQAKKLAKYRPKRDKFLKDNPICMIEGCRGKSTLHHAKGREGANLTDESTFRNLCIDHHRWVEEHPEKAKKLGLSLDRLG